jgi:hypothetical protein
MSRRDLHKRRSALRDGERIDIAPDDVRRRSPEDTNMDQQKITIEDRTKTEISSATAGTKEGHRT